jgi:hypothetical protein
MTTAAAQIATGVYGFAALVELHFTGGVLRVSTLPQNIDWNGFTWTGLGYLGNIDDVAVSDDADVRPIALTLNISNSTLFALANGGIETYRGQAANIYYAVMDETCTTVCTDPKLIWFGVMDVVSSSVNDDGTGVITMRCEPHSININRKNNKRVSHQQQLREFPGDLGYEYLEEMIGKPSTWLSKKFQQI